MQAGCEEIECDPGQPIAFSAPCPFKLEHQELIRSFIDPFHPESCEFNFSNLFCWQDVYQYSWFTFKGRLVIYDGVNRCGFLPPGAKFLPDELLALSRHLICLGFEPDISIFPKEYEDVYPEIERFYTIREERDNAEYIYRVDSLAELNGTRLHKKRNLISQFKRSYPDYSVMSLKKADRHMVCDFTRYLLEVRGKPSRDLEDEFTVIEKAFNYFDCLGFEGLGLKVKNKLVAFCLFSRLNHDTYNIQFEKSDMVFKGAAQVINRETARYLRDKCVYVNREQDLGIEGLRRAKLSYGPERLIIPHTLIFKANM
ncbi:MAG: DUF2156 domain-containing protein [Desulfobacteraceae bacterium]|nr:DUF2156 domain-containing protein [Desulfobacteraceae bacterium]